MPAGAATNNIFTAAGTGSPGLSGDGGPATGAQINLSVAVEVTADGGYLIADQANGRVRKVAPDGTITTVAGTTPGFGGDNGPATAAQLSNAINGLAQLPDGSILIADSNNNRVRKVSPGGTITTVAGTGAPAYNGDNIAAPSANVGFPTDLAVRSDGSFLIADNDNHRVRLVDPGGTITTVAGTGAVGGGGDGGPATSAQLAGPSALAVSADGGFLVAEIDGHRVRRVAPGGAISTVVGKGTAGSSGDSGPATAAEINQPAGLATRADGGFIVSELGGDRVRAVTPSGVISTVAGTGAAGFNGDDMPATMAQLSDPLGVAVNGEGDYLIADASNHRVRRIDAGDPNQPPPPNPDPDPGPDPGEPAPTVTEVTTPTGDLVAGRPGLLTPQLDRPAQRIDWDVNGDGDFDASCPGDKPSLRLRMPPRFALSKSALRAVNVRALGIGGFGGTLKQQIEVSQAPAVKLPKRDTQIISRAIERKPVYLCAREDEFARVRPDDITQLQREQPCLNSVVTTGAMVISGCLRSIPNVEAIPPAERNAVLGLMRDELGIEAGSARAALALTDGLIATGEVYVNGMKVDPVGDAKVVLHRQIESIVSSNAALSVGGVALEHRRDFRINTLAKAARIPLGNFRRLPGGLRALGFLGIEGDVDVELVGGDALSSHAVVTTHLKLPPVLGGFNAKTTVRLHRNGQFDLDSLSIGPIDFAIGPIGITGLKIDYSGGIWRGQLRLCVLPGACLDARPDADVFPQGGVEIGPDGFRIFANVFFPGTGLKVGPGVFLNRIGAGLADPPLRFLGGAKFTAAGFFDIEGGMVFAFPMGGQSYRIEQDRATIGNGFRPDHYTRQFRKFTIAAAGRAFMRIPAVGRVELGGAHLLYSDGYVAFGGGLDTDFFGIIRIRGGTAGEFNFNNGRFNLHGETEACIADIPLLGDLCRGATVHVSSVGAGGCVQLGPISVGGGLNWETGQTFLWPADGCRWSVYRDNRVLKAQAADTQVIRTAPGDPTRVIELRGEDGAPRVRVTSPGGKTLESTDGPGFAQTEGIRILRSESLKLTVVALQDPAPGDHTITRLEGSPRIAGVRTAEDQPAASVKARVGGTDSRRTLTYDIAKRDGQRVTFFEEGGDGAREIGSATSGRGTLKFTPAPGGGKRKIVAQFTLAGVPAERVDVTTFRPPAPTLARAKRLRVKHSGSTLRLAWAGVTGARTYQVVATLGSGGTRQLTVKRGRATVKGVPRWASGRVTVRALAPGREGGATRASFKPSGPRPKTRLAPMPR